MRNAPDRPFFADRLQIVELARRRYFEDGVSPAGVVSEAVFQSWARCQRLHDGPHRAVEFQPVTESRTRLALQRNRHLHDAWQAELPQLQRLLGTTSCAAMLTDGSGVMIGATCAGRPHEHLIPVAARLGVDLSEEAVGTTAPGVVVRTGAPVSVIGAEHFFDGVRQMHCAAVPIRDTQGRLAGVLDISSEAIAFGFDAATVVGHLAGAIENRLLLAQAGEHLVLRLQVALPLLESSAAGLLGIDSQGRVAWLNGQAARLLGLPDRALPGEPLQAEAVLGQGLDALAALPSDDASPLPLPSGLVLWARSEGRGETRRRGWVSLSRVPAPAPEPSAAPPAQAPPAAAQAPSTTATVRDAQGELLQRTLQACGGNLSEAARVLGVSRGWVYRRLPSGGDLTSH
ncbi:helix-turn-helix domain-containing protein [Ideonella alba]|uniref:GAF domain-containing protein n=1 Tax=Ideonella alba TaxID=2824118 RepID=A0A941BFJ7_9BURK|nr:helix-turn-helix domain-containing protein [Ideonella alba]MBQ0929493.1 GAF domain-containing protein [Ideonella alba]